MKNGNFGDSIIWEIHQKDKFTILTAVFSLNKIEIFVKNLITVKFYEIFVMYLPKI